MGAGQHLHLVRHAPGAHGDTKALARIDRRLGEDVEQFRMGDDAGAATGEFLAESVRVAPVERPPMREVRAS